MMALSAPLVSQIAGAVLIAAAAAAAALGVRRMSRGLREARSLELIRGIRVVIYGLVAALFAIGVLSSRTGFLVLGGLILAEELYETGLLAALIRSGDRPPA